ncbi:phosphoadenosine phosphosulfate reductase family protein [Simonsiella muelleri]|uniref:Phosphoadenosine phosphosulphate reductase domain-containing protein n=1 Tax=Simonsiella muelleri ATCC 29453 TaxID=641147 RepID=V9H5E6_9NEIS|nr:phosphoadenosine phosphosulfate reductase family protein [Simonsiella muelleri]AUX61675.1 phosphoadenosine phosphosulfate reductase [Simonsiella muelleri ATCC 29453]EFG29917.1 hypothetical protein HMPREF9021_02236 [Simonsiella muelleri ATCC 29453]UBQ53746.1 phosphoadenosine phosphosulfate reductase family protein [Simonsiella muelleri]
MSNLLFETIKAASRISDKCIVFFSGGKDSIVTLDLCARYFKKIHVVFMYSVPNLSFQEANLRWYESKYGIKIERIPHFMISEWLRLGTFRKADFSVPIVSINDVYNYARISNDMWWIAAGERIADSIVRRAMIKNSGSIDEKRGRIYPVAHFSKADIMRYIQYHSLKLAPESRWLGHSFRSLDGKEMLLVKQYYPQDYEKIRAWFPFVDAAIKQYEMTQNEN